MDIFKELSNIKTRYYSQGCQDAQVEFITQNIKIKNKFCIEFGYEGTSYIHKKNFPNTGDLIVNKKWNHLLLDGNWSNPEMKLYKHFLTPDNICDIFKKYKVPNEIGYLSVDLDSCDFWILDNILKKYSPSFYTVEYNPNFPIDCAIVWPNNSKEMWERDSVMNSSLKAYYLQGKKYGYSLVYAEKAESIIDNGVKKWKYHHDAFFIKDSLLDNIIVPKLEDFKFTHTMLKTRCKSGRENIYLDYEELLKTGNVDKAKAKALPICKKWLCSTWGTMAG
jgi:hypothetical protein